MVTVRGLLGCDSNSVVPWDMVIGGAQAVHVPNVGFTFNPQPSRHILKGKERLASEPLRHFGSAGAALLPPPSHSATTGIAPAFPVY